MNAWHQVLVLTVFGIFLVEAQDYAISTVAGGTPPPTPVQAMRASISGPQGVATDGAGNIYFSSRYCVVQAGLQWSALACGRQLTCGLLGRRRSGDSGPTAQLNQPDSPASRESDCAPRHARGATYGAI
jgi:hypothetical protein